MFKKVFGFFLLSVLSLSLLLLGCGSAKSDLIRDVKAEPSALPAGGECHRVH